MRGCKRWTGYIGKRGYPVQHGTRREGVKYVHVRVLEQKLGRKLKPGMEACHRCGNRWCVAPAHLYEGTHRSNMADMVRHGRSTKGERQPNHKLTDRKVLAIRASRANQYVLAARYGVDQSIISKVINRKIWRHI